MIGETEISISAGLVLTETSFGNSRKLLGSAQETHPPVLLYIALGSQSGCTVVHLSQSEEPRVRNDIDGGKLLGHSLSA